MKRVFIKKHKYNAKKEKEKYIYSAYLKEFGETEFLNKRQINILNKYLLENKKIKDIAKEMSISLARVSQIKDFALRKLFYFLQAHSKNSTFKKNIKDKCAYDFFNSLKDLK